jgi:thiol-disulfide isomerase/thioredoxin
MRATCLATLAFFIVASSSPLLAAAASESACSGASVLERAARVYREAVGRVEVVSYEVRVPGAPPHHEETEFGFGTAGELFLRMPQGFVVVVRDGHLFGFMGSRTDAYVARAINGGLQAAVDEAFKGVGPPLVPVPILLSQAFSASDRIQAFASKLMAPLSLVGCAIASGADGHAMQQVDLQASNGTIRADFDGSTGRLRGFALEVVPAPGQAPIRGEVRFEAVVRGEFPPLPQPASGAAAVSSFAEIDRPSAVLGAPLQRVELVTLDGATTRLDEWRGSVVVLEFWASWCAPCRLTLPVIEAVGRWARQSKLPVEVFAVNTLEGFHDAAEARVRLAPYLEARPIDVPVALDLDGSLHQRLGSGLPLTAIIDTTGHVAATYAGFDPALADELRATITALVGEPRP